MPEPTSKKKNWKSIAFGIIGILLAGALIAYTIVHTDASPLEALANAAPLYIALAFACNGLSHLLGGIRWGILLKAQGIHLTTWQLFRLTLSSVFTSNFIPGAASGDIVKFAFVLQAYKNAASKTAVTCIVDRISGLLGLLLTATIGSACFWLTFPDIVHNNPVLITVMTLLASACLATCIILIALIYHRAILTIPFLGKSIRRLLAKLPQKLANVIRKVCDALDTYRNQKTTLLKIIVISMTIHAVLGSMLFFIGRAIGETQYSFGVYFLNTQVSNGIAVIPTTPGGLGIRDSVTVLFFQSFGQDVPPSLQGTIPIIYSLILLAWGLLGAWPVNLKHPETKA